MHITWLRVVVHSFPSRPILIKCKVWSCLLKINLHDHKEFFTTSLKKLAANVSDIFPSYKGILMKSGSLRFVMPLQRTTFAFCYNRIQPLPPPPSKKGTECRHINVRWTVHLYIRVVWSSMFDVYHRGDRLYIKWGISSPKISDRTINLIKIRPSIRSNIPFSKIKNSKTTLELQGMKNMKT